MTAAALLAVVSAACSERAPEQARATVDGEEMLLGPITRDELIAEFPVFDPAQHDYAPNDEAIAALNRLEGSLTILVFLGTWCEDSQDVVPKFFSVMDALPNLDAELRLFALDRDDQGAEPWAKGFDVEFVPTIIVLQGGEETGRIVEFPDESVEADLFAIAGVSKARERLADDPAFREAQQEYLSAKEELVGALETQEETAPAEIMEPVKENIGFFENAVVDVLMAVTNNPDDPTLKRTLLDIYRQEVEMLKRALNLSSD